MTHKNSLILLVTIVLGYSCTTKTPLSDLDRFALTGNIKSLSIKSQDLKTKDTNVKKEEKKDSIEKIEDYDGENERLEEENTAMDSEFFFNTNGMITESRRYAEDQIRWVFRFTYNSNHHLVFKDQYNSEGDIIARSKITNSIDHNGNLIKQVEYESIQSNRGKPIDTTQLIYPKFPEKITDYFYDTEGTLSKIEEYDAASRFWRSSTTYNKGKMMSYKTVDIENDSVIFSELFKCKTYDDFQNCIKYLISDEEDKGYVITLKVEYNE